MPGGQYNSSNSRVDLDRHRNQAYAPVNRGVAPNSKRNYSEFSSGQHHAMNRDYSKNQKSVYPYSSSRRLRRNDHGTDDQAEDSGMEDDVGGSSQDRFESDFIDDDGRE